MFVAPAVYPPWKKGATASLMQGEFGGPLQWRLDRLGRSPSDLVKIIADLVKIIAGLERDGITFESLCEKIDTGSASVKLQFHVFTALADFERNLIRERTLAVLSAARARGRVRGRKPKHTEKQIREIKTLLADQAAQVKDVTQR